MTGFNGQKISSEVIIELLEFLAIDVEQSIERLIDAGEKAERAMKLLRVSQKNPYPKLAPLVVNDL